MLRRPVLALASVLCLLAVSACGDDTEAKNAYVTKLNAAQTDFKQTFERLEQDITPTSSVDQDQRTLTSFRTAVDDAVKELREVTPPDDVKDLHARFIAAMSRYGEQIDRAKQDFLSENPQEVQAANVRFAREITETARGLTSVIGDINRELAD